MTAHFALNYIKINHVEQCAS